MNWISLLRMAQWARNPPSPQKIKIVVSVVLFCLALYAIERWIGWPDAFSVTPERVPTRIIQ